MSIGRSLRFLCFFVFLSLSACETQHTHYAPVMDISMIERTPKNGVYVVKASDTLYSIAWRYGFDYRVLANRNHLASPYTVFVGEKIYLRANAPQIHKYQAPFSPPKKIITQPFKNNETVFSVPRYWKWPASGPVVGNYSELNKGLNIEGYLGAPIFASAAGKVVYCGNGLRAYGNLIIIKHNNMYLSAYAFNQQVLVKQGEWVRMGQKIAEMGKAGQDRYMLHFEIRRNGSPVNPLIYLRK